MNNWNRFKRAVKTWFGKKPKRPYTVRIRYGGKPADKDRAGNQVGYVFGSLSDVVNLRTFLPLLFASKFFTPNPGLIGGPLSTTDVAVDDFQKLTQCIQGEWQTIANVTSMADFFNFMADTLWLLQQFQNSSNLSGSENLVRQRSGILGNRLVLPYRFLIRSKSICPKLPHSSYHLHFNYHRHMRKTQRATHKTDRNHQHRRKLAQRQRQRPRWRHELPHRKLPRIHNENHSTIQSKRLAVGRAFPS